MRWGRASPFLTLTLPRTRPSPWAFLFDQSASSTGPAKVHWPLEQPSHWSSWWCPFRRVCRLAVLYPLGRIQCRIEVCHELTDSSGLIADPNMRTSMLQMSKEEMDDMETIVTSITSLTLVRDLTGMGIFGSWIWRMTFPCYVIRRTLSNHS